MKLERQKIVLLSAVLALIAIAAGICNHIKSHRKLGPPGLKMVAMPVYDTKGNVVGHETIDLPSQVLNCAGSTNLPVTLEELSWLPKDTTYGRKLYTADDRFAITVNVVMMGLDSRSIHKPEICLPGQGWRIDSSENAVIPVERPSFHELPVKKLTATKSVRFENGTVQTVRTLYIYWFVADGVITADHLDRNWKMAVELVRSGTMQRWAYVACMSYCLPGQEEATYNRMKNFIAAAVPDFQLATGKSPRSTTALTVSR
jgi:hypothetical protein